MTVSRRKLLQRAGLGIGLATSGKLSASVVSSKRKELLKVDVLVVGGGPAGIGAALGAAKAGAKTMLIEAQGFFGGVAAWSLGMPINQMQPDSKPRSTVHELILEKLKAYGDQAVYVGQHQWYCNVDYLKVAVLDALDEVGCEYLVHLSAVDTLMEGNRVTGVVVGTKQGLANISAKAVVDCTGDADVAFFAGAETMMEMKEPRMPNTLLLGMANVTPEQIRSVKMKNVAKKARSKYPLIPKSWALRPVSNCHHYWINHTGTRDIGQFDTTDPFEFSLAECVSRRQALQMTMAMREFGGEGLKDVELVATGPRVAVRETRRVKGGYVLTEEDAAKGRKFDDVVAWRSGYLDLMGYRYEKMRIHIS
jgi:ribulose 1,5-bisphosphate synthetase/thiazole synthase